MEKKIPAQPQYKTKSRISKFANINQRRKFTSRFKRKVKDFYDTVALNDLINQEDFDNTIEDQPQDSEEIPADIQNHITQTPITETFFDGLREYKALVPATLLHIKHSQPPKQFYQKIIVKFDLDSPTHYHSILNQSIN